MTTKEMDVDEGMSFLVQQPVASPFFRNNWRTVEKASTFYLPITRKYRSYIISLYKIPCFLVHQINIFLHEGSKDGPLIFVKLSLRFRISIVETNQVEDTWYLAEL